MKKAASSEDDVGNSHVLQDEDLVKSLVKFVDAVFLHILGYFSEGNSRADGSWKPCMPAWKEDAFAIDSRPSSIWVSSNV